MQARPQPNPPPPDDLSAAIRDIFQRPFQTLIPTWSWKAAACTALLRGLTFFVANLRSGDREAVRAMTIEIAFAILPAGLIGAISQRLRASEPLWATAAFVWFTLPGAMLSAQLAVHRALDTRHLAGGVLMSLWVSALFSAYTWYAMRHGALLGGSQATSIEHDILALPAITWNFVMAIPHALMRRKSTV